MKYIILLVSVLVLSSSAYAQACFSPGCPTGEPAQPIGPTELCLPDGCQPVTYSEIGGFTLAGSFLSNGYPIIGWSGPCLSETCPDIRNQAFSDLEMNAKRANRAQRYGD